MASETPRGAHSSLPASRRDMTKSPEDALMFRKEVHLPWQQRAGSGTRDAGEGWSVVDVNVVGQELSASLPSARTSGVSKSIGLKATQHSQVWRSPTRTGKALRRLELCLLQL